MKLPKGTKAVGGFQYPSPSRTVLTYVPLEVGELSLGVPRAMEPNHLHFMYLFFRFIENGMYSK